MNLQGGPFTAEITLFGYNTYTLAIVIQLMYICHFGPNHKYRPRPEPIQRNGPALLIKSPFYSHLPEAANRPEVQIRRRIAMTSMIVEHAAQCGLSNVLEHALIHLCCLFRPRLSMSHEKFYSYWWLMRRLLGEDVIAQNELVLFMVSNIIREQINVWLQR